jgi:hypothetical protein
MNYLHICFYLSIDWLSAGTLFVTFVTACAALLTVRQVKKQRETSYFPELYLVNKCVYVYGEEWKGTFLPFDYFTEKIKEKDIRKTSHGVNMDIFNVGFAVAKGVEYEWSFDLNGIIDMIHKSNKLGFFHIYSQNILKISVPQVGYTHTHVIANQLRKENINYILQASVDKTPTQIMIPSSYLDLFMIYACNELEIFETEKSDDKIFRTFNVDFDNFPPLEIDISYKDLQGKKHSKKFKIIPNLYSLKAAKSITKEKNNFGNLVLEVIEM